MHFTAAITSTSIVTILKFRTVLQQACEKSNMTNNAMGGTESHPELTNKWLVWEEIY